jgi:uncharacterized protein with ParB-like and HNH nuclease domain
MGVALLLFNLSRPRRLIELSNLTQTASRTLAENTRSSRGERLKADPISVGKVLSENHRFVVPIYQRTYAWTEKRQLEPLFAQIEAKAQERLEKGTVAFPHYMGSLLVIPEGEAAFGRVQAFDIVDGQQRLTTFHICFAAMRDIARRWGFEDLYKKFESLLLYGDDEGEVDKKNGRYKLQPTAFDRDLFRKLIDFKSEDLRCRSSSACRLLVFHDQSGGLSIG